MTPAQQAKYFAEWGQLRDVLRARGLTSAQCEQYRRDLTRRAIGIEKSSKELTNPELDKVLALIAAERAPADFNAQIRLQDSPEKRFSMLLARVEALAEHMDLPTHYVDGIARRMFGRQYHELPERALQQIEGILRRRLRKGNLTAERIAAIEREVAAAADRRLAITGPAIDRQAATKAAAAAITSEPDDPSEWF
jgi:hypothetical protein